MGSVGLNGDGSGERSGMALVELVRLLDGSLGG